MSCITSTPVSDLYTNMPMRQVPLSTVSDPAGVLDVIDRR